MSTLIVVGIAGFCMLVGLILMAVNSPYAIHEEKEEHDEHDEHHEGDDHGTAHTTHVVHVKTGYRLNPLGATLDIIGAALFLIGFLIAFGLIVDVGRYANLRRLLLQEEGPHAVMDKLRLKTEPAAGQTRIEWDTPKATALWISVNVYTEEDLDPATEVLDGTETVYELPKNWVRAKLWYSTAQGPSVAVELENPVAKAAGSKAIIPETPIEPASPPMGKPEIDPSDVPSPPTA